MPHPSMVTFLGYLLQAQLIRVHGDAGDIHARLSRWLKNGT